MSCMIYDPIPLNYPQCWKFKNRIIAGRTIGINGGSYTIEEIARLLSKHCAPAVIKDGKVRKTHTLTPLAFLYHTTEKYQRVKNHFWWLKLNLTLCELNATSHKINLRVLLV